MEEFDQILKKALKEKAPEGFTDKLMDRLVVEQQTQIKFSPVSVPGKKFLFIFLGLFGLAIFSAIYFGGSSASGNPILNNFNQLVSQVHFQIGPTVKLLAFSMAAIFGFLMLDYIFRTRKVAHI
jgi:hypothetical protein